MADVDHGKMDGFIKQRDLAQGRCKTSLIRRAVERPARRDGLSHRRGDTQLLDHAKDFALDDRMFEPE